MAIAAQKTSDNYGGQGASKGLYDLAVEAVFLHEEMCDHPACGEDLIIWPDHDHCNAEDLPEMGHKSDDFIRVSFDSNAYDIISCQL